MCIRDRTDAPEIITRIAGKVIDGQTNEVLSGVQISTTPPTSSFITQQDGSFSLSDLLPGQYRICLLYTSDAADERSSVDLGGRRIIKKKNTKKKKKKSKHIKKYINKVERHYTQLT